MKCYIQSFLYLCIFILSACQDSVVKKRPNVIFLFADDQRYNTIHRLGNEEINTPNLDLLTTSGVTFTNTYIMGSTSGAVCAPSRAMLLTGKTLFHLDKNGEWDYTIPSSDTTFIELLRQNGYVTFGAGKQHNGKSVVARGFTDGGHFMFGGMSSHYEVPVYDFNPDSIYDDHEKYMVNGKHSTDLYTDDAVNFIQSYTDQAPFFLYLSFQAPHDPREMPERFLNMYNNKNLDLPPNFLPHHPFDNGELVIRDEQLASFPRTEEEILTHLQAYYAMISHLDENIGKLMNTIQKKGLSENTLIIFSSDNGLAVGQHGLMGKQNLYEHSIKIPFIISGPDIPENRTSGALCYLNDLYPTLCDYLGLDIPSPVETRSFIKNIQNPDKSHRDLLVFAYKDLQRGIRKGMWKLIEYNVDGERNTQLFNLEEDPWETKNLAIFPGNQPVINDLRENLKTHWMDKNDPGNFWE